MINVKRDVKEMFIDNIRIANATNGASDVFFTGSEPDTEEQLPAVIVSLDGSATFNELGFCGYVSNESEGASMHEVRGYSYDGTITMEIMAMSALTKDLVFDVLTKVLMTDKNFIHTLAQEGIVLISGSLTSGNEQATPFEDGTNQSLYSDSIKITVYGEVFYDTETMEKVDSFKIISYLDGESDPEPEW